MKLATYFPLVPTSHGTLYLYAQYSPPCWDVWAQEQLYLH